MAALAETAPQIGGDNAVLAAIRLVNDWVPADKRPEVEKTEGAAAVGFVLTSTDDPKAAGAILDWLENRKPPFTASVCLNVSPQLPETIRQRAARLAETMQY